MNNNKQMMQTSRGVYEFIFGGLISERNDLLSFWKMLGFEPVQESAFLDSQSEQLYEHKSNLQSIRLEHPGCTTYGTGYVRLQLWENLINEGLQNSLPLVIGSRWMGIYTNDINQVCDSFMSKHSLNTWKPWMSPLVNAALQHPPAEHNFFKPFVGLREKLVFGHRFRLAFIQRAGFDRPGFGTFDNRLPYKNTEGTHANIVQPSNSFSSEFYKAAFDFETAPYGDPHDSGSEPPTIEALELKDGETFHIERTRSIDCPTGLIQIYSSYQPKDDLRNLSRPGCGNLSAYSIRIHDLDQLIATIESYPSTSHGGIVIDEFGMKSVYFTAPDGYPWIAVEDA